VRILDATTWNMTIWIKTLRLLFLVVLSIYTGGFTFYSVVVIRILHDRLESSFETGLITQRVTDALNALGGVTLLVGWCVLGLSVGCRARGDRGGRWQCWALAISSICLVVLLVLHRVMDHKLATGTLTGFYPWHRAYLWTSTVQWVANVELLIQSARAITPSRESRQ
jgi:hypothetical protein